MDEKLIKYKSPFYYQKYYMIMSGILELPHLRWPFYNAFTVFSCCFQFNLSLSGFLYCITDSAPFFNKMEAFLICTCNLHLFSKIFVLPLRKKELYYLIDLFDEMSKESYHYVGFDKIHKRDLLYSRRLVESILVSFASLPILGALVSILNHVITGSETPPLQVYIPFEKEGNFYWVCAYCVFISAWPVLNLSTALSTLGTLILNTSTQMSNLIKRLEALEENGTKEDVKKCIALHQKVLKIVDSVNELLSSLLFLEYLLTTLQCCFSGYRLFLADEDSSSKLLGTTMFILSIGVPCVNCLCGQVIKDQSEQIFLSAYNNSWYRLDITNKKMINVLMLMASKTLTINCRQLLVFDMVLFGAILKASYSLITALQTLGTG